MVRGGRYLVYLRCISCSRLSSGDPIRDGLKTRLPLLKKVLNSTEKARLYAVIYKTTFLRADLSNSKGQIPQHGDDSNSQKNTIELNKVSPLY